MDKRRIDATKAAIVDLCSGLKWDWMGSLCAPQGASLAKVKAPFAKFIAEIEKNEGTASFRWATFVPRPAKPPIGLYILVGGLASADWVRWSSRWDELQGVDNFEPTLAYLSSTEGERVEPVLSRLLAGTNFDVAFHAGSDSRHRKPVQTASAAVPERKAELCVSPHVATALRARLAQLPLPFTKWLAY